MPRKTTPQSRRAECIRHAAAAADAAAVLQGLLAAPAPSDSDVCDCPEGNAEGITEAECGCRARAILAAAKVLEAAGCYIRRNG